MTKWLEQQEYRIKPGEKVTCALHPERGVGTCTAVIKNGEIGFVVWGEFGKMDNRIYDILETNTLEHANNNRT